MLIYANSRERHLANFTKFISKGIKPTLNISLEILYQNCIYIKFIYPIPFLDKHRQSFSNCILEGNMEMFSDVIFQNKHMKNYKVVAKRTFVISR